MVGEFGAEVLFFSPNFVPDLQIFIDNVNQLNQSLQLDEGFFFFFLTDATFQASWALCT